MIENRNDGGPRFSPGTFADPSAPAPVGRMLRSQARMELSLFLRNGEQLLLALVIPLGILVALVYLPIVAEDGPARIDGAVAVVLAVSVMASAFTGQAIAVGFDRRYGALKRLGATPLPPAVIIGGKSLAMLLIAVGQCVVLGVVAAVLGWRPGLDANAIMSVCLLVGVAAFSALGLFLGGLLKAEIVLALANLVWFLFVGAAGLAVADTPVPGWVDSALVVIPSHGLTTALLTAQSGGFPLVELLVLAAWGGVGAVAASRTFSFT